MPRVKILNENFDTPSRQFPVGTAIQLTCQGQVGSDKSKVRMATGYMYEKQCMLMSRLSSVQNKSLICSHFRQLDGVPKRPMK